ncbi:zinc-binding alcohol dehydrogenase family protein [Paenibacillus thalictri]|uniref:Zinc-binding alcohol dehydrogenase family protein n=1 Tax=Paenibacillus thalictri TaxID=2527873 RepID=A0A4Q9DKR0_9BACL|nr:zinc-binding alcohol dehydrogenase family protein [Paenibacillus thalictri]TBL75338.1 zinc-binding alcohol dehydrogenase family protein [Paenibacillus thalictri]
MKTIVCEEPYRFVLKETETPVPAAGEALIKIRRIGICGTDLHAYRGNQPFFTYPRILGHELSGEIAGLGPETSGFALGDRVTVMPYLECGKCIACRSGRTNCCTSLLTLGVHCDGGMQEYYVMPVDHLIKADGLSLDQAAVVECLCIGAHAVERAALRQDEFALVIGAGPIGLGAMKYAKLAGAKVIAMDINEERLAFCKSWAPADYTVNVGNDPLRHIAEITGGDMPTAVLDATGNAKSMEASFQYAANGGRIVFVGLVKSDITFNDPEFHRKELTLMSSRNATRRNFEQVIDSIRGGHVDTDRFITHKSSFEQMIGVYDAWLKPETGVIKAMVEIGND